MKHIQNQKRMGLFSLLCCVLLTAVFLFVCRSPVHAPAARIAASNAGVPATAENHWIAIPGAVTQRDTEDSAEHSQLSSSGAAEDPLLPSRRENRKIPVDSLPEETASVLPPQEETGTKNDLIGKEPAPGLPKNEEIQPSAAEETLSATYSAERVLTPAAASGKTIYVSQNGIYTNMLANISDTIDYELTVFERGVLNYALSTETEDRVSWKVRLYQEYYVNGNYGETALRCLNTLNASAGEQENVAPAIGLAPGNYIIRVTAGSYYVPALYSLSIEFFAGMDYEIEFNDTVTRYTEIYTDVAIKGSASYYEKGQDTDWYMLRTYNDCALSLLFAHTPQDLPTVAFKVTLYDANLQELYSGNSIISMMKLQSGNIGVPAGVYYIQVQGRVYYGGDYILKVSRETTLFETERNDTPATATPLQLGRSVSGALTTRSGSADKDYYVFSVATPGYVTVVLKNTVEAASPAGFVRRLAVTDSAGVTLFSALLSDSAEELQTPSIGLSVGTYYVRVDDADLYHNSDTYEVSYAFTPSTGWERENNNTFELATPLAADVPISGTLADVETDFDTDWYVITVNTAGQALLNLSHESTGGVNDIFRIALFDADLQQVGETVTSYENTDSVSEKYTVTPGKYYIKITAGKYKSETRYFLNYSMQK